MANHDFTSENERIATNLRKAKRRERPLNPEAGGEMASTGENMRGTIGDRIIF